MELEVIEEKENPLLGRREILVRIAYPGSSTPGRREIRSRLAAKLGVDEKKLVLGPLKQRFGVPEAVAKVKVYSTQDLAQEVEPSHIIKKNFELGEEGG